jgi:hypothetical protein
MAERQLFVEFVAVAAAVAGLSAMATSQGHGIMLRPVDGC